MKKCNKYRKIESILYAYTYYKDEIERLDREMNKVSTYDLKCLESKRNKLRRLEKLVEFTEKAIDILDEDEKRLVEAKYFWNREIWGNRVNRIIEKINVRMVA